VLPFFFIIDDVNLNCWCAICFCPAFWKYFNLSTEKNLANGK